MGLGCSVTLFLENKSFVYKVSGGILLKGACEYVFQFN